jgi:hypothetical protein
LQYSPVAAIKVASWGLVILLSTSFWAGIASVLVTVLASAAASVATALASSSDSLTVLRLVRDLASALAMMGAGPVSLFVVLFGGSLSLARMGGGMASFSKSSRRVALEGLA